MVDNNNNGNGHGDDGGYNVSGGDRITPDDLLSTWSSPTWTDDIHVFGVYRVKDDNKLFSVGVMETLMELIRVFTGARIIARTTNNSRPRRMLTTVSLKFDDDVPDVDTILLVDAVPTICIDDEG